MPIPAGPLTPVPPGPVVTPPPPTVPGTPATPDAPARPTYTAPVVSLTSASGKVLQLIGRGFDGVGRMHGTTGIGLAPSEMFATPVPDGDGSVFLGRRSNEREVFIPAVIGGRDYVSLRGTRRTLEEVVTDGPVLISVREPDSGESRSVTGWYAGGLEGNYGRDVSGVDWQTVGLTFRCPDPIAYGDPASAVWSVVGVSRPFLSVTEPFFPVVLGDSLVGGERVLRNAGDVDAWPVTVVTGPGSGLVLENVTTGKSFALSGSITQPVTIDTRRVVADVFDAAGDLWDRVALGSSLFPLVPGENRVRVTLAGASSASKVAMSWQPPYRSLH